MRGYRAVNGVYRRVQENKLQANVRYYDALKGRLVFQATRTIKLFYLRFKMRQLTKVQ